LEIGRPGKVQKRNHRRSQSMDKTSYTESPREKSTPIQSTVANAIMILQEVEQEQPSSRISTLQPLELIQQQQQQQDQLQEQQECSPQFHFFLKSKWLTFFHYYHHNHVFMYVITPMLMCASLIYYYYWH